MIEKIISSGVRLALLKKLILHSGSEFYLRELSSELGFNVMTVRQELQNLCSVGLVKAKASGNRKYFAINIHHLLFPELKSMIIKTIGVRDLLIRLMNPYKDVIHLAFIFGSIATGNATSESDIDFFVIGRVSPQVLSSAMRRFSDETGREVNYHVMEKREFVIRLKGQDHFIVTLMNEPKIFIIGDEDGLRNLAI